MSIQCDYNLDFKLSIIDPYKNVIARTQSEPSMADIYGYYQNTLVEPVNCILKYELLIHDLKNQKN